MPDLFSPFTPKGVTLRNRIAMSPMTMYRSTDAKMNDFHVMPAGSRAAGGFGLVFLEQLAITPEGRTSVGRGGIYDDDQIPGPQAGHRHHQGHGRCPRQSSWVTPAARAARSSTGRVGTSCRRTTPTAGGSSDRRRCPTAASTTSPSTS